MYLQQLHRPNDESFTRHTLNILGKFTKLQKATLSFIMSVCPSAQNNSALDKFLIKFDI
jgi:hypothetical protein